jgi:hypothetical protein
MKLNNSAKGIKLSQLLPDDQRHMTKSTVDAKVKI